jgi:hydroxypyruvate isomerase
MLRFSANLGFLWAESPLVERVRAARTAGFDAVEFHFPYDVPAADLKAVLAEAGPLPVVSLNTRRGDPAAGEFGLCALPGREAEGLAAIDEAIAYGQAIGAASVHVMAGIIRPEHFDTAERTFAAALDHAGREAERAGMEVVIEPINQRDAPGYFLRDTAHVAHLIEQVGRPNVKMLFDCYHTQITEGDLTRRLERHMPIIGHIQIAAVPSRAEPDEGEIAYDRLLETIEALGYRGFVGAEYRPRGRMEDGLGWLALYR